MNLQSTDHCRFWEIENKNKIARPIFLRGFLPGTPVVYWGNPLQTRTGTQAGKLTPLHLRSIVTF